MEACLRTAVHRVSLDGGDFLVVEVEASREATLRALYGDLAPLALVRAADDVSPRLVVSPGRDEVVRTADRVVLVGTSAEVMAAGLVRQPARRQPDYIGARAPRLPAKRPTNIVLFALRSLDRRIRLAVSALLGLTALSTVLTWATRPTPGRPAYAQSAVETLQSSGNRDQQTWCSGPSCWSACGLFFGSLRSSVGSADLAHASRRLVLARLPAPDWSAQRAASSGLMVIRSRGGGPSPSIAWSLRDPCLDAKHRHCDL